MENVADTERERLKRRGELLGTVARLISDKSNEELAIIVDAIIKAQYGGKHDET